MTAIDERFWAGIDKQVADATLRRTEKPTRPHILPTLIDKQVTDVALRRTEKPTRPHILPTLALVRNGPEPELMRMPAVAAKWSGVLDIISEARVHAEAHKAQLLEQAETFEQTIQEMREDAKAFQQQIRVLEAQLQEAKADADRQLNQVVTYAVGRVRDIAAEADIQIAQARSSAQSAEDRAAVAEEWLKRIEEAAKSLAPNLETTSICRAA